LLKNLEMEENEHQLIQHELEVHEVMRVHREEGVFPSIYPCSEFMKAAGILQDFQTLISNAGLKLFVDGEPYQYVKLTMSVVQDFRFCWSLPNPMVHYKIYNTIRGTHIQQHKLVLLEPQISIGRPFTNALSTRCRCCRC
jgi:hypothetical protein